MKPFCSQSSPYRLSVTENHFNPSQRKSWFDEMMNKSKGAPLWRLKYLYMGTSNVQKDVNYYIKVLGAKKIWDISSFGTR